jgi:hypothetical protein
MAPRANGDGLLLSNDITIVRQMVVGMIAPDPTTNELRRADSAPRSTCGDGVLTAADTTQARRYVAGVDAPTVACGQFAFEPEILMTATKDLFPQPGSKKRTLKIVPAVADAGARVVVTIELASRGDETSTSFTLNFDPAKLSNPLVALADGSPTDAVLTTNTTDGQLMVLIDADGPIGATGLKSRLMTVSFDVAANAAAGQTEITFGSIPTASSTANSNGDLLPTYFADGSILIKGPKKSGIRIFRMDPAGFADARDDRPCTMNAPFISDEVIRAATEMFRII